MKSVRLVIQWMVAGAAIAISPAAFAADYVFPYSHLQEAYITSGGGYGYDPGDHLIMSAFVPGSGQVDWELGFDFAPRSNTGNGIDVSATWAANVVGTRIDDVSIDLYRTSDSVFGPGVPRELVASFTPTESGAIQFSYGGLPVDPNDGLLYLLVFNGNGYDNPWMNLTMTITDVPEPATWALFGLGLAVLGFGGWRAGLGRRTSATY
jgi:hypothetical protein